MPCTQDTCINYTPSGDGSGEACASPCGVIVTKNISPTWDTSKINAPTWQRDRIMYYYDDVCQRAGLHTTDNVSGVGTANEIEYGLGGVTNPNAGRVSRVLTGNYFWAGDTVNCPSYTGFGRGVVNPIPLRYWDHFPSEQSFEPIRSDSWFSYIYDTANGAVGKPCFQYCYQMYTRRGNADSGGNIWGTFYSIKKIPYTCPCSPQETYVNYDLEDGKITTEGETDPYPLIWTVGTKQKRIAFSYPGAQITANVYVRAYGLTTQADVSNQLGTETLLYTTSGSNGVELYTEFGTYEKLLKSGAEKHRYNTELEVRSGTSVLGYLSATFRPVNGVGDGGRPDSVFKIIGIKLKGTDSNSIVSNTTYDLYVRREKDQQYVKLGVVRFTNITRTDIRAGVAKTFHMSEPKQVTASNGTNLESMGFYRVWNANVSSTYMSSQGSNLWKARNTKVTQDFSLPNGTILRMNISAYWDSTAGTYYTRWKVDSVIRYGSNYVNGDGTTYSGQNVFYLYYPSPTATEKVGVAVMVSGASDKDWSEGATKIVVGDTVNGWKVTDVKHCGNNFNTHVAYITDGSNNFAKDTAYTTSSGIPITVKAGWGIKDRAAIIGSYEFQRKQILYVTAYANLDVPQEDLDVVKPSLQAIVSNGKVTGIQILKPGLNLTNSLIEPIKIAIQPPPGFMDRTKYLQFLKDGMDPADAWEKSKGTSKEAKAEPIFTGGELTGIKMLNNGSGYSSTQPPGVAVPYIKRKFTTVEVAKSSANKEEPGTIEMMKTSEAFKLISKKQYSYNEYQFDPDNPVKYQTPEVDVNGEFTGKNKFDITKASSKAINKTGFSVEDYAKIQESTYSGNETTELKGSIKSIDLKKNSQILVNPKSGLSKESAQAFLPPSNKNHNSSKNNDYTKLLGSIDTQTSKNSKYYQSFSDNQQTLISTGKEDPAIASLISKNLDSTQNSDLNSLNSVISKDAVSNTVSPTDTISLSAIESTKTISIAASNLDDGNYYGKEFKNFYRQNKFLDSSSSSNLFEKSLNKVDTEYEKNINSLWEMDKDENRTIVYDGAAVKVVDYGFFNLPCATRSTRYMIHNFCPDPRKNTFMRVNVGVKVAGKNYDSGAEERGPCTQCLYENSAIMSAYTSLVNAHGAANVDLSDAFCVTYDGLTDYASQSNGLSYRIPHNQVALPYASTFTGYGRALIKSRYAAQLLHTYEGCRDYEFSGYLEILHDRLLESKTFTQAISRYGNPYSSICNKVYEDAVVIDEQNINNIVSASNQYDSSAPNQLTNPTNFSE